jgi:glycosyltransferase involved in cell wall biosynthesis
VISCLRRAGVEVAERHMPVWEGREHKWAAGIGTALRLGAAEARLAGRTKTPFDALVVGYPGHFDLPAARRVARERPVVFNPLVSLADTLVHDRGRFRPGSLAARALARIDRAALRMADLVVADTAANAAFLAQLGGLQRVDACFVGAEERLFRPGWMSGDAFLFVGKLIPLHGLETILEAARRVPELPVRVVGTGQLEPLLRDRPQNVEWVPWIEYEQLADAFRSCRCALGVFGTSAKAGRVIPNKVFQALACGAPVITADTPAARELLVDGQNALLVPPGDPEALAGAMRRAAGDPDLLDGIAAGGLRTYRERAGEDVLGRRWRELIEQLIA